MRSNKRRLCYLTLLVLVLSFEFLDFWSWDWWLSWNIAAQYFTTAQTSHDLVMQAVVQYRVSALHLRISDYLTYLIPEFKETTCLYSSKYSIWCHSGWCCTYNYHYVLKCLPCPSFIVRISKNTADCCNQYRQKEVLIACIVLLACIWPVAL
jgi:hypothetical protein